MITIIYSGTITEKDLKAESQIPDWLAIEIIENIKEATEKGYYIFGTPTITKQKCLKPGKVIFSIPISITPPIPTPSNKSNS